MRIQRNNPPKVMLITIFIIIIVILAIIVFLEKNSIHDVGLHVDDQPILLRDGNTIIYPGRIDSTIGILSITIDGRNPKILAEIKEGYGRAPILSNDEKWIVYQSYNHKEIYLDGNNNIKYEIPDYYEISKAVKVTNMHGTHHDTILEFSKRYDVFDYSRRPVEYTYSFIDNNTVVISENIFEPNNKSIIYFYYTSNKTIELKNTYNDFECVALSNDGNPIMVMKSDNILYSINTNNFQINEVTTLPSATPATDKISYSHFKISYNEEFLYYYRTGIDAGRKLLERVNLNNGVIESIFYTSMFYTDYALTHDDSKIVVSAWRETDDHKARVYIINSDGKNEKRISDHGSVGIFCINHDDSYIIDIGITEAGYHAIYRTYLLGDSDELLYKLY